MATVPNETLYKNAEEEALKGVYKERAARRESYLSLFAKQKDKIEKRIGTNAKKETNAEELARLNRLIPLLESQRPAPSALVPVVEEKKSSSSSSNSSSSNSSSEASPEPITPKTPEAHVDPVIIPEAAPLEEPQPNPCPTLYDPCTKEPLTGMPELEKRVKEIKQLQRLAVEGVLEKLPGEVVTRLDLLVYILNRGKKPDVDLLNYAQSGHIYEALWDIVICFGLIEDFPINPQFYLYKGRAENIRTFEDSNFTTKRLEYLDTKNINEGASGASDITFMYKQKNTIQHVDECSTNIDPGTEKTTLYFCSSKYYRKDASKGVDKYDIQNIFTAAKSITVDHVNKIILLVKDRSAVTKILKNALRKYIAEEASYVFGIEDLIANLTKLYDTVHEVHREGPVEKRHLGPIFGIEDIPKPLMSLRLHQHMAVDKISAAITAFRINPASISNKFLVGILPRGGKTYIAGGLVHALQPKNVVVLLGAKSETLKQFKQELFEEYSNFSSYKCIDLLDHGDDPRIDTEQKHIFVMSVELYKTADSSRRVLQSIKSGALLIDLFICDEAHLKQTTHRAARAMEAGTAARAETVVEELDDKEVSDKEEEAELKTLDGVLGKSTPVVYMTGTYIKPLTAFKIPDAHVALWDYEDIQMGKQLSSKEEYFTRNFGEVYERALAKCMSYGETHATIEAQYQKFPELYLFSTELTPEAKAAFATQEGGGVQTVQQLFHVKAAFNPEETNPLLWHTGFTNPAGMARLLNYLCPQGQLAEIVPEEGAAAVPVVPISSVMKEIDYLAQSIGDRLGFFTSSFVTHSQLWFLPHMQGHPLKKRMCALAGAIFQLPWFRENFEVVAVSSSADWRSIRDSTDKSIEINGGRFSWKCPDSSHPDGLKGCLTDLERAARARGKGLIILAQNMLHLGISMKCVDIVVLLDEGKKVDERIQKMYRALTESTNKKGGYIVDMNYFRTVTAIMNYAIQVTESRKGGRVFEHNMPDILNKVFDVYSFNATTSELQSTIEKTLPEMQRLLGEKGRGGGDSIVVGEAGDAMNRNIDDTLGKDYTTDLDAFLGMIRETTEKERLLRTHGADVAKATERKEGKTAPSESKSEEEEEAVPDILNPKATEPQKRAAYIDIFKTTLKLGVFGTNAPDVSSLIERLQRNEEFRDILFDTLAKRGAIVENVMRREDQQRHLIDGIIIPGLRKLVDTKKNVSYRGMKESFEDERKYPGEVQKVLEYITEHLDPKDTERTKLGEVFTPLRIVDEMLDSLPKEVWTNPKLKWLDPANGIGNFPIKVFLRLCDGLKGKVEDPAKHIVENMLFMIDINGKNNEISRKLFTKLAPEARSNIEKIDTVNGFLANKPLIFNGKTIKEFDIIMGNPPYNTPKTETGSNGNNIWTKFVIKSFSNLTNKGYLLFVHPPGWKKPASRHFNPEKFSKGDYTGEIQQGQIWEVLKGAGVFKCLYINDQLTNAVGGDYIDYFPAVDYYVYQKGGEKTACDIKNIFLGKIYKHKGVRLNYTLNYLPNLLTQQTQDILYKMTSKEGDKPDFKPGFDPRGFKSKKEGDIKYLYDATYKGPNYAFKSEKIPNVDISKIVLNENGGIKGYYCKFIDESEHIGVLHHTLLFPIEKKGGKNIEKFFNSNLVKFIFLITQYVSGKMPTNERLVANSLTIPPEDIEDYYKFFDIEEHKAYIEEILAHYSYFKPSKRKAKTEKAKKPTSSKRRTTKAETPVREAKKASSRRGKTKATSASKKGGSLKYGRTRKARRFW